MAEFHCNLLRVLNPDRVIMTTFSKSKRDHAGVKKSWCDRLNEKCSDKAKATLWRQKKYGLSPLLLLWATLTFMPPVGLRLSNYLLIYKERSKDSVCVCVRHHIWVFSANIDRATKHKWRWAFLTPKTSVHKYSHGPTVSLELGLTGLTFMFCSPTFINMESVLSRYWASEICKKNR